MPPPSDGAQPLAPAALVSVDRAAEYLDCSRSTLYSLIRKGELDTVSIGRARRVVVTSMLDYVARATTRARRRDP